MRRPWVKLWREETPGFARLSFCARALYAMLLKATDDHGVVLLAKGCPANAIGRYFGADRGDRRMIKKALPELIEAGYVHHDEAQNRLQIDGFADRQATTNEPPSSHDGATKRPRRSHEATTTEPRSDHEDPPKSLKSLGSPLELDKELEEELDKELLLPPTPSFTAEAEAMGRREREAAAAARSLRVSWTEAWRAAGKGAICPPATLSQVATVAEAIAAEARARGVDPEHLARSAVGAHAAHQLKRGHGPRADWFAQDPLKHLGRTPQAAPVSPKMAANLAKLEALDRHQETHAPSSPKSEFRIRRTERDDGHAEARSHRRPWSGDRSAPPTALGARYGR